MAQKYKRKHYFINPQFQTRFLISFIIPNLIIIFFIGIVMFLSSRQVIGAAFRQVGEELHGAIRTKQMHITEPARQNEEIVGYVTNYAKRHAAGETTSFSGDLLLSTTRMLVIGLIVVLGELCFLTVFVSHKIAGPIYRFERFSESFGSGYLTARIYLRKGDEMTGTADKLNQMADRVQEGVVQVRDLLEQAPSQEKSAEAILGEAKRALNQFKLS